MVSLMMRVGSSRHVDSCEARSRFPEIGFNVRAYPSIATSGGMEVLGVSLVVDGLRVRGPRQPQTSVVNRDRVIRSRKLVDLCSVITRADGVVRAARSTI